MAQTLIRVPKVRKVSHRDRKHFVERANGPYAYGVDVKISGNIKVRPAHGTRTGLHSDRGNRTKREKSNSAERNEPT